MDCYREPPISSLFLQVEGTVELITGTGRATIPEVWMLLTHFLLLHTTVALADDATNDSNPNIVITFTDDQGYADLSCFGGKHVSTSRID